MEKEMRDVDLKAVAEWTIRLSTLLFGTEGEIPPVCPPNLPRSFKGLTTFMGM